MPLTGNTAVYLQGIGAGQIIATDGSIMEVLRGQNLKVSVSATSEDVFGGDGLYPVFTFLKEKGGKVEIDVADFFLNQLKVTQNASIDTTTAKRYYRDELTVASGTAAQLSVATGVDITTVTCFDKSTGTPLTRVATMPTASQFSVTAMGVITFGTAATNKAFVFSYYASNANAATATIVKNAVPGVSELRWSMTTESEDGIRYQVDIRAKRVKTEGDFSLDFGRGKASVQKLSFKILDPGAGSADFCTVTVTQLS